ncbi:MAG TPA: thioredoxin family protein [Candidatus Polarisedimenticolia bacterium]|jgi:thiol-disulfide isomerase/thioredoxin|nr:thioredoxin family protein [Candidatus Polarisedimenticolia bacterium]
MLRFALISLVLASAWAFPAGAMPIPPTEPIPLAPTSTFRVEVDGAEVRAPETYLVGRGGLLIMKCALKGPVFVMTSDQTVRYIPPQNVIRDAEGNVSLKGAPSDPICSYQVNAGQILFQAEGRKVRLSPRAPLVGPRTLEEIIEFDPDYESRIKGYKPDAEAVAFLSKYSKKTDIQIYFGSWCSHCEAWVPRLIKAIQSAANASLETHFVALPMNIPSDPAARAKGIQGVPTILLVQDGREVGRLNGPPEAGSFEGAVVKLLRNNGT